MPIASTDIIYRYSAPAATGGNTVIFGGAGTSRGNFVSSTVVPDGGLNNLFPDVTGDENAASNVDYQCVFIHNNNATLTLKNTKVWIASQVAGGANATFAVDNILASALAATVQQAALISNKNTAPSNVSAFSAATTKTAGLALGDLAPGQVRAVWISRAATNSGALANDGVTLRVEGDTSA